MANQRLSKDRYTEEPNQCEGCGNQERMRYSSISLNGDDLNMAWICDACGHAHVQLNLCESNKHKD